MTWGPLQLRDSRAWPSVAVIALALGLTGCPSPTAKSDAGAATSPCDDDPYGKDENGENCPCVGDPTQDFCPDPCALEPPAKQCVQDAGPTDVVDDVADVAKPDIKKPDVSKDGAGDGAVDGATEPDVAQPDGDDDTSGPLPDLIILPDGKVTLEDGAAYDGPLPKPDAVDAGTKDADATATADGDALQDAGDSKVVDSIADAIADAEVSGQDADTASPDIGADGKFPLPDGSEVQGDGTVALPDGKVIPKEEIAACNFDSDCVGPAKACLDIKCVVDLSIPGGRKCDYIVQSFGALCTDNNPCTGNDKCDGNGKCEGLATICEDKDDNPCTQPTCDPVKGCILVNAPPEVTCNDGNPCTSGETCNNGKCDASQVGNKCQCQVKGDCAKWEDGNLCNGTLICKSNACVVDPTTIVLFDKAKNLVCDEANDGANGGCATNKCNAKTGKCEMTAKQYGSACSDGDACTAADMCVNGACKGLTPTPCDDKNICTLDTCDKTKGCQYASSSLLCDDGDPCTDNDVCQTGQCLGTPKGLCECITNADCKQFDDDNKCNGWLACIKSQCVIDPKTIVACPPGGSCNPQHCEASTGGCVVDNLTAGTPCTDNSQCTVGDNCDGKGFCNPGVKIECDDKNPCTADECLPKSGCLHKFTDGVACTDGDPCTIPDVCALGKCKPGDNKCECVTDQDCLDKVASFDKCAGDWKCVDFTGAGGVCTYSATSVAACKPDAAGPCATVECVPATGKCVTTNLTDNTPCNDGVFCTTLDRCFGGKCTGDANNCDDGLPCTADSCDETVLSGDACKHDKVALEGVKCSDGSACTSDDICATGFCTGKAIACDDKNVCTVDKCDKLSGCTYAPTIAGTSCDDANACTGDPGNNNAGFKQDFCDGTGKCKGGDPKVCAADNPCVDIPCNPTATQLPSGGGKLGCENKISLSGKPCNDGNACTTGELCQVGFCSAGTPTSCDDNNDCTQDGCDKLKGCGHNPVNVACDDKDPCTEKDLCQAGKCFGLAANCDDENICTLDSCDAAQGCVHKAGVGDCGDFAKCSADGSPKCEFKGGLHLVISEVFVGDPLDAKDDWVEIHNPTDGTAKLGDYVLEARPYDADSKDPWTIVATGKAGVSVLPHRYVLLANGTVAQQGVAADVSDPAMNLAMALKAMPGKAGCTVDSKRHLQLRLRDVPHQLEHDRMYWDDGQAAAVPTGIAPVDASPDFWPTYASIERHASEFSDAGSMAQHRPEWLAGNAWDTGKDADDFLVRYWPDPQNFSSNKYEPACSGTCALGKLCSFDPGAEKCLDDVECKSFGATSALACGAGKLCGNGTMSCIPEPTGSVVISEIYFGADGEQYVELYNAGSKPVPIAGWRLQKKDADAEPYKPWVSNVAVVPAGTVLPAKRYYLISSQAWARTHGQTDLVQPVPSVMEIAGGALRVWDPSSDTELDLVGWGTALTYSNAGVGAQYKPATPVIAPGYSLERKAKLNSTQASMKPAGGDDLAGNAQDSNADGTDFIALEPTPQTLGSGVYEPACASTCPMGLVCNYVGGAAELCVDPLCGIPCDIGYGCNPKSQKCDIKLLLAEVATDGPATTNQKGFAMQPADNEYVVLYNPSPSTVQLAKTEVQSGKTVITAALVLQMQGPNDTVMTSLTDSSVQGKPLSGGIAPYSYYLIAPSNYDKDLPTPDFVAAKNFNLPSAAGSVRLASTSSSADHDKLAWGAVMNNKAEGKLAADPQVSPTCGDGQGGALRRRPGVPASSSDMGSATKAAYFQGAGQDTNVNQADWARVPLRTPRTQKCGWPTGAGQTGPFCVGYPIGQRP